MRANFLLINKIFWKRPFNILLGIVCPIILSLFASVLFNIAQNTTIGNDVVNLGFLSPTQTIPEFSLNSINLLIIGCLPSILFSLKTSDILKRINFGTKTNTVSYGVLTFYFFILSIAVYIVSIGLLTSLAYAISGVNPNNDIASSHESIKYLFKNANYGEMLYALIIYVLSAISISFLIGFFAKTLVSTITISFILIIFCVFLDGGLLPLQSIAQQHGFLWVLTYFVPYKWATLPLLESWMQGAAVNSGSYDWNGIVFSAFVEKNFPIELVDKLGKTSIFDFTHPFITNIVPIPYIDNPTIEGVNVTFNSWYPSKSNDYQFTVSLWAVYWLNITVPNELQSFLPVNINSIPTYTFATSFEKGFNLIAPISFSIIIWIMIYLKFGHTKKMR